MGVVRRARVLALVILVNAGEEQGAVGHDDDVFDLIGLEQSLVFGPSHVLEGRIGFYVTVHDTGHAERQVLHRGIEGYFGWICKIET